MKIVALDPGETTGWALYETAWFAGTPSEAKNHYPLVEVIEPVPERGPISIARYNVGHIQPEKHDHHNELYNFLDFHTPLHPQTILIYEVYEGHSEVTSVTTAEYVGVIKLIAARKDVPLVAQRPQVQKFWDRDKITQLGLWIPGQRHGMSALRHILHYQVFEQGRDDILEKLK